MKLLATYQSNLDLAKVPSWTSDMTLWHNSQLFSLKAKPDLMIINIVNNDFRKKQITAYRYR